MITICQDSLKAFFFPFPQRDVFLWGGSKAVNTYNNNDLRFAMTAVKRINDAKMINDYGAVHYFVYCLRIFMLHLQDNV